MQMTHHIAPKQSPDSNREIRYNSIYSNSKEIYENADEGNSSAPHCALIDQRSAITGAHRRGDRNRPWAKARQDRTSGIAAGAGARGAGSPLSAFFQAREAVFDIGQGAWPAAILS